MANAAAQNPAIFDTDFASYAALTGAGNVPVKVKKIALVVGSSAATAGVVQVTDVASSANDFPPMAVASGAAANAILFSEQYNPNPWLLQNFAVSGLTATGTKLYVWTV